MQEELSFGVWLRKQRRALDLSRQAFADRIGCAEVTLRRIEAGTLKPSKELASILLEKLGILESERPQWISFARGLAAFPLPASPSSNKPITNLPAPLTTFVGREKEQADVIGLIAKYRLVTLTGSGGVGKTRLSIKAGKQVLGNYADGVWLVELASILDPQLVPRTTAITIGLRDEPQRPVVDMLSDYLREKKMLLVLDNCEHLLDACVQLADTLLKRCPDLKILATSRELFGTLGEAVYRVPSLGLPDSQLLTEKFRDYESMRLFEERAQLARTDFSLTMENAPSVAKICSRLDGIPLAIELAAARVSTFSTEQVEEQLRASFSLLTTGNRTALPRHQTLRATIEWSYDLLSPAEQTLFRRLSVFVNGWTLEAAESICSDANINSRTVLDLFTQLINKSLVIAQESHGRTRYRMLETIRQYSNAKLVESGKSDGLRDRHLEYFLNLAETAEPHLIRPEQLQWLAQLDADYENLKLALEWTLRRESPEPSQTLCWALRRYWSIRWYCLEGLDWVTRALAMPYQNESMNEKLARARALYTCADLEWLLGNLQQILSLAQASLALASEVSNKKDIAIARFFVGSALGMVVRDDMDRAISLLEESFTEFQVLDEPYWQAAAFSFLGSFLVGKGRLKHSDVISEQIALARQSGERLSLAHALADYADVLLSRNQADDAKKQIEESDRLYKQISLDNSNVNSLFFAELAWTEENYEKARSLYIEMRDHSNLLGAKFWSEFCTFRLGILALQEGDLEGAREYLENALVLTREGGHKPLISLRLVELSNLFYLRKNLDEFKRKFGEALAFKKYFAEFHKSRILMTILGSLYFREPESSARLLGAINRYEVEDLYLFSPVEKRYCSPAETYARKSLGDATFESAFAEGQEMSLDGALDLALKTVEEM